MLPTLAIAFAVPHRELGLIDGINLAFREFFDHFGMGWGTPVISLLIALGAFASVVAWIAGPSRGLLAAARTGLMPPALQKRNAHDVQEGILIPQGIIVTVLALLFVLIPNGNTAFATLVDMATALYLVMYMLVCRRDSSAQHPSRSPPHVSSSCDSVGRGRRFRRFRRGIRVDFRETGWFHRFG